MEKGGLVWIRWMKLGCKLRVRDLIGEVIGISSSFFLNFENESCFGSCK